MKVLSSRSHRKDLPRPKSYIFAAWSKWRLVLHLVHLEASRLGHLRFAIGALHLVHPEASRLGLFLLLVVAFARRHLQHGRR